MITRIEDNNTNKTLEEYLLLPLKFLDQIFTKLVMQLHIVELLFKYCTHYLCSPIYFTEHWFLIETHFKKQIYFGLLFFGFVLAY